MQPERSFLKVLRLILPVHTLAFLLFSGILALKKGEFL